MHKIEKQILEQLESGRRPTLRSIGGFQLIFNARDDLADSRFSPDILGLLTREVDADWPQDWRHFILKIMQDAMHGPTIQECIEILDAHPGVVADFADSLFDIYSVRAADATLGGLTRTAFLDGCIRLVIGDAKNRFRLIDVLTRCNASGFGPVTKRYVKIVGVCNCHWPCEELHNILLDHRADESCVEEASLELGMHHFCRMLCADRTSDQMAEARQELTQAEQHFETAGNYASVLAEATLYRLACRMLRDFHEGELSNSASLIAEEIDAAVTALHAYHRNAGDPSWLGSRTTEIVFWRELGRKLRAVDGDIEQDGWFDPREVIETAIVPIFNASRCLLKRNEVGGVEALIQPRLIGNIASRPSHVANIREWLRRNADSPIATEVSNLVSRVESDLQSGNTTAAVLSRAARDKIFDVLDDLSPSAETQKLVSRVVQNAMSLHLRNWNAVQQSVLVRCVEAVKDHPDYQSADVRTVFETTLLWMIHFVDSRLDLMTGDIPEVKYLFRRSDGSRALEQDLQNDFMTLFRPFAVGSQIEVRNVGGGRADVYLKFNAERMIVEVKREDRDCSFDALASKYSAQTIQYQNTSSRLGFMLVLDQTDRGGKALHIFDAIRPVEFRLNGETEPRHVIMCLVSGDRLKPSELSKLPKSKRK